MREGRNKRKERIVVLITRNWQDHISDEILKSLIQNILAVLLNRSSIKSYSIGLNPAKNPNHKVFKNYEHNYLCVVFKYMPQMQTKLHNIIFHRHISRYSMGFIRFYKTKKTNS